MAATGETDIVTARPFDEMVAARKAAEARRRKRHRRIASALSIVAISLVGCVSMREVDEKARRSSLVALPSSTATSPSAVAPFTHGMQRNAAKAMLHAYTSGQGAEGVDLLVRNVKEVTGCLLAFRIDATPKDYAEYRRSFRETWRGDSVVFVREGKYVAAAVFRCES